MPEFEHVMRTDERCFGWLLLVQGEEEGLLKSTIPLPQLPGRTKTSSRPLSHHHHHHHQAGGMIAIRTQHTGIIQGALLALLALLLLLLPSSQAFIPPSPRAIRRMKMMATPPGAVAYPIRVAFQGEPGAYSEKALRELLGPHVVSIGKPSFDDTFKVSSSDMAIE